MAETPPEPKGRAAWPKDRVLPLLRHPAVIAVLTVVLGTAGLGGWIQSKRDAKDKNVETQRIVHERELKLKATIVSQMGTASARFLGAMEARVIDAGGPIASVEYRAFKERSLEIESQLAAYFPDSQPLARWRDYTFNLRNAYLLLQAKPGQSRNDRLNKLNRYLDQKPTQYDGLCFKRTNSNFDEDLRELVVALQKKEQQVVRSVTSSPSVLTGTPIRSVAAKLHNYDSTKPRPCDRYPKT